MHRWLTILAEVNKLCGCYDQILGRNQSERTIQDKVIVMHAIFLAEERTIKVDITIACLCAKIILSGTKKRIIARLSLPRKSLIISI